MNSADERLCGFELPQALGFDEELVRKRIRIPVLRTMRYVRVTHLKELMEDTISEDSDLHKHKP